MEETALVQELRAELAGCEQETEALRQWASDECLHRFLRARAWSIPKALKMIKDTIQWRSEYKPEAIIWDQVAEEAETGKMYRLMDGDKLGRPVVVMRPRNQNTKDHDGQIRLLVYTMENAISTLPPGSKTEAMTWVIDFNGYTLSKAPPMKTSLETLHVLQSYYPERLGQAVLYCPPRIFSVFWKMIHPFIDPVTAEKIVFVNAGDSDVMSTLLDMGRVESELGGTGAGAGFVLGDYEQLCRAGEGPPIKIYCTAFNKPFDGPECFVYPCIISDDARRLGSPPPAGNHGQQPVEAAPSMTETSSGRKWGWKGDRVDPERPLSPAILGVI